MSPSNVKSTPSCIPDHEEMEKSIASFVAATHSDQPGDPRKLVKRIIDVVKSEGMAVGKPMPQRLPIGGDAMAAILKQGEATLQLFKEWESLITSTNIETSESA